MAVGGGNGLFGKSSRVRLADNLDGTSNTFAVGERDLRSRGQGAFGSLGDPVTYGRLAHRADGQVIGEF